MPVNWSGSRSNLDKIDNGTSPDHSSPNNYKWPSLTSVISSNVSENNDPRRRLFIHQPHKSPFADSKGFLKQAFSSNMITTSKYSLLTFIPKNLYEQFRGIANFYFLSLVILQVFDWFATVSIGVSAAPIIFIVFVTALKDGIEDLRRHQSDNRVNRSISYTLNNDTNYNHSKKKTFKKGKEIDVQDYLDLNEMSPSSSKAFNYAISDSNIKWTEIEWQNIKVGDFVFLRNNDPVPADMMIISTSEAESLCFIETKDLDGETNLKVKKGLPELSHIKTPQQCAKMKCIIECELPHPNLYIFNGVITLKPSKSMQNSIPITAESMVLRGCTLRNTDWIIGIVLCTGSDTKIMQNLGDTPAKRSRIDRQINPQVILNFVILLAMCFICAMSAAIYQVVYIQEQDPYLGITKSDFKSPAVIALITFFRAMIAFQNIIPIALYISIDIAKTFQSYFILRDLQAYDEATDSPVICQSWKLCDDLGQVEYIFSDKTGTLTSNQMELRRVSINGSIYGKVYGKDFKNERISDQQTMKEELSKICDPIYISEELPFVDPRIHKDIHANNHHSLRIREFFTLLALCHTVLTEKTNADNPHKIVYKAQSPDEAALVLAAKDVGFTFLDRVKDIITVNIFGEDRKYELLKIMEFNSFRKRMSIIVKRPEGEIILICKGADCVILERLKHDTDLSLEETTRCHLEEFANDGLRTLCLAYRIIPAHEYESWADIHSKAQKSLVDREKEIDKAAEMIERELNLVGVTAIEDKLQEGVPESIAKLSRAGIKIWVLTGDKMETAINIGFSCNLLKKTMDMVVLKASSPLETEKQLLEALDRFWHPDGTPVQNDSFALILEGDTLRYALEPSCKALMLELSCRCKAVMCCRVSPLQKAKVVQMVRVGLGAICLSIGDGSNDVSMIQEADIGIGISGKEGLQAVMASDYAIAQFRFLTRLLLVHGRWSYLRTAKLVLNYFYKNVVWIFVLFWYQFDCGFSTSFITDFTYSIYFNTFFSALPTMYLGIFDQDISEKVSINIPNIYFKGIQQTVYTSDKFWSHILEGVYQSIICYYVMYFTFHDSNTDPNAYEVNKDAMGTFLAHSVIFAVNTSAIFALSSWTVTAWAFYFITIMMWVAYAVGFSFDVKSDTFGVTVTFLNNTSYYLGIVFCVILCLLPRITAKFIQQYLWPTDLDIIQEIQKKNTSNYEENNRIGEDDSMLKVGSEMSSLYKCDDSIKDGLKDDDSEISLRSYKTGPLKSSKKTETAPRSKSEDKISSRTHAKKLEREKLDKESDKICSTSATDGFDIISEAEQCKSIDCNVNADSSLRSRKPSVSSIIKEGVGKATRFLRTFTISKPKSMGKQSSSIIFLGNQGITIANTGFAFSQDAGVSSAIQTSPDRLSPNLESPILESPITEDSYEEEVDVEEMDNIVSE